jgi:cyclopropane fatty-acyl-phospholipid synthase-like methyltransferase
MIYFLIFLLSILILFLLLIIIYYIFLLIGLIFYAPWVPLEKKQIEKIFDLININQNDVLYDLGSGDGKIVILVSKKYKIKTCGIEILLPLVIYSKIKAKLLKLNHLVKIKWANFYKVDLSQATIVIFYLMPKDIKKLVPKFKKELKPGTRIISAAFSVPDLQLYKIETINGMKIYFYQI